MNPPPSPWIWRERLQESGNKCKGLISRRRGGRAFPDHSWIRKHAKIKGGQSWSDTHMNRAKGKGEVVGMGIGRDRRSGRHDHTRSWLTAPRLSLFSILMFPLPFLSTTSPSYNHSSPLPFISANVSTTAPSSQVLSCWYRGQSPFDCPASLSTLDSPPCPSSPKPVYSVFLRQERRGEIGIPQGRRRKICAPGEGVDLSQCA